MIVYNAYISRLEVCMVCDILCVCVYILWQSQICEASRDGRF
jgi:hypothetical protein